MRLLIVPSLVLALASPSGAFAAEPPPETAATPKASEVPPDDPPAATPTGATGSWDRRFFDLPVKERDKRPIDPLLAERLTSPEIEQRAKETRFAASAIGTGATLMGLSGLVALGGAMSTTNSDTPYWIAGVGAGIGITVLAGGLIALATRPDVPASVDP